MCQDFFLLTRDKLCKHIQVLKWPPACKQNKKFPKYSQNIFVTLEIVKYIIIFFFSHRNVNVDKADML